MDLSDGVLGSPARPEPICARMKVRLENGLQHQLQRSLHDPVGDGRDTQAAELAVRLRDHHLPHRIRPEYPLLEFLAEPLKQSDRLCRTDRRRCGPIGTG